ncbi:MAG: hypothetical protein ACR2P6_08985, partial [Gammaproteobacteria bacterium]
MLEKYPDMRLQQAIIELNQQFIRLLLDASVDHDVSLLGMTGAYRASLARLTPEQLDAVSALPCLLAEFRPDQADDGTERIAEATALYAAEKEEWINKLRLFAAEILTFIWQIKQHDPT